MKKLFLAPLLAIFAVGCGNDLLSGDNLSSQVIDCNQFVDFAEIMTPDFLDEIDELITQDLQIDVIEWNVDPIHIIDQGAGELLLKHKDGTIIIPAVPMVNSEFVNDLVTDQILAGAATSSGHFYLTVTWLCGDNEFPKIGAVSFSNFLIPPDDSELSIHEVLLVDNTNEIINFPLNAEDCATVCHCHNDKCKTLKVTSHSVQKHLDHGDVCGVCEE